jgi:transcriptional regulator with XRE-family HTH domain
MDPKNRGHAELLRLTARRGDKARIARLAGVEPNQLTQWTEGGITPSGPSRTKLEKVTGIRSTWWDESVVEPKGSKGSAA